MRPVLAINVTEAGRILAPIILIVAFIAMLVMAAAMAVLELIALFSPIIALVPIGRAYGYGMIHRPLRTAAVAGIVIGIAAAIAWHIGLHAQLAHAANPVSTFRLHTLPLIAWSVAALLVWTLALLAAQIFVTTRDEEARIPYWIAAVLALTLLCGWFVEARPHLHVLANLDASVARDRAYSFRRMNQCLKENNITNPATDSSANLICGYPNPNYGLAP